MEENKNEKLENTESSTPTIEELKKELEKAKADLEKQKQATTNASADASKWKNQYRASQTDADREKAEREDEIKAMKDKLASFEREKNIATYKSSYIAMGYKEDLAEKKATAMTDGNIEDALSIEREFLTSHDKELGAAALKNTKRPETGTASDGDVTKAEFDKMTFTELCQFKEEHPELYAKYIKK